MRRSWGTRRRLRLALASRPPGIYTRETSLYERPHCSKCRGKLNIHCEIWVRDSGGIKWNEKKTFKWWNQSCDFIGLDPDLYSQILWIRFRIPQSLSQERNIKALGTRESLLAVIGVSTGNSHLNKLIRLFSVYSPKEAVWRCFTPLLMQFSSFFPTVINPLPSYALSSSCLSFPFPKNIALYTMYPSTHSE